jgi:hypothetical protein
MISSSFRDSYVFNLTPCKLWSKLQNQSDIQLMILLIYCYNLSWNLFEKY